jgi:carboxymethylenebutenolidase
MCDEHTIGDAAPQQGANRPLSRRRFNVLTAGAAVAMSMPAVGGVPDAGAPAMVETDVQVPTPDGSADCYFVHPATGRHPAVIVWPDILGLRPAFRLMGRRLAEAGYAVLVVNPYYRTTVAPVVGEGASFRHPEIREKVMPLAMSLSPETHVTDARALVAFLDRQGAVDTARPIGTTGYCMGGPIVMRAAAALPERIGAAASFHGSRVVTDAIDSPHLLVPQMRASFLFAIAEDDDEREPEAKHVLRRAYDEAGVPAEIEVYPGALHGWCVVDSLVYHEVQAERAWARMLTLFATALA